MAFGFIFSRRGATPASTHDEREKKERVKKAERWWKQKKRVGKEGSHERRLVDEELLKVRVSGETTVTLNAEEEERKMLETKNEERRSHVTESVL